MPTTKHETKRPPVVHDVEIRIQAFKICIIEALMLFTLLIIFVGMFWVCKVVIPSGGPLPMPSPLRWACIVFLYLNILAQNARYFYIIVALTDNYISRIEPEKRPRDQDLGTRVTNLEDQILAIFCVIAGLSTIGFVVRYWFQVIALGIRSLFYWTCTMGGLCLLFWLFRRGIRLYRRSKGLKHEEAWGILIGLNILQLYDKFEGLKADGTLGQVIFFARIPFECLRALLDTVGFTLGRGPLFDRIPDGWKAARRACKTPEDIANHFAVFAGSSDEEGDKKEDSCDRNDFEDTCFPPSVFEWEPNPVILPHLRSDNLQPSAPSPSLDADTTYWHLADAAGLDGTSFPNVAVDRDGTVNLKDNRQALDVPRHNGPATMSASLSSFACPNCAHIASKKWRLKQHINRTHNLRFRCAFPDCGQRFGLRTNLERHEATHTGTQEFKCPNSWCKTPEQPFTREDNVKKHMRRCVTSSTS